MAVHGMKAYTSGKSQMYVTTIITTIVANATHLPNSFTTALQCVLVQTTHTHLITITLPSSYQHIIDDTPYSTKRTTSI